MSEPIQSPCILVCSIDTETGYCFGCGRTGEEIAAWTQLTPEQRRAVMDALAGRLATITRKPRRQTRRRRIAEGRARDSG
ncbi:MULTISPECIES: DUF1289 domain-containing protein [unclassified Roseitalea]|uniref:DUF1289 domain-containing protein n=1 Tax=unclassified Roseitalea TaxID=2639107 RepID=UPI00273D7126|nr:MULTISPECIES: DUF1289 domain-containing protein [unclassified Roseitalea]